MVVSEECAMKQELEEPEPEDATEHGPSGSDEKHVDPTSPAKDFHPIRIKGEPLSVTILRDRR
jgi:hypothetical protein